MSTGRIFSLVGGSLLGFGYFDPQILWMVVLGVFLAGIGLGISWKEAE